MTARENGAVVFPPKVALKPPAQDGDSASIRRTERIPAILVSRFFENSLFPCPKVNVPAPTKTIAGRARNRAYKGTDGGFFPKGSHEALRPAGTLICSGNVAV